MEKDVNFIEDHYPNPSNNPIKCGEIVWNNKDNFHIYCIQCTNMKHSNKFTNALDFIKHTAIEHLKLDYSSFDEFLSNDKVPESIDLKLKMESFNEDLISDDVRQIFFDNLDSTQENKTDSMRAKIVNSNINEKYYPPANDPDQLSNFKEFLNEHDEIIDKHSITEIQSVSTNPLKNRKRKKILKIKLSGKVKSNSTISKSNNKIDIEDIAKLQATETPSARPERMPCEICGKVFNKYRMSSHLRSHDPDRFAFKCDECEKLFVNQKNLDFHFKSFHLNDGRKFFCNINGCTKNFATQIALRNHAKTHTNTEDRPFKCDCCHRRFLYDSDKRKHMRIMHINGKTFACDKCDRTYYLEYDLNRHKVVHNEIKPWPCDECQATFISRHTLARHKKCHSNIKEYVCNICQKEFAIYEYLFAHMKTHGISSWNAKVYKKNQEASTEIFLDKGGKST